ncbi:Acyltransferase 3 [Penicillium fimorum]|uniref:Acyltransferase 3 n=1 Tax=Penicillium fimorum TaxID=1882269 RepID=A0A9W9XU26_9EURO|nr:Acyltransferase 3 [Penicillium fimorum]
MTSHHEDRATTSASDIPLKDLESASSESDSVITSRWNGFSQFHPSNILAHPEGLAPKMSQEDWLAYSEDKWHRLTLALTPSFLQHLVGSSPPQPTKLHAIAALDGLRGWACLLVFNFHFLFTYTWKVAIGWGFGGENFGVHQLPFFHMLISGHIMVAIFFVLSGYVLSYKPLKTIRSRSFDQTFTVLASGTFRRAFRLYIPAIAGILCVFVAVRLGLYNYSLGVIKEGHTILGTNEQHPHVYKSLSKQSDELWVTLATLMNPFEYALYYNHYNPHLWTIPLEFRSSLVLFVVIMGTSRLVAPVRMTVVSGLVWFCMRYGRWELVLFLFGMLMAEVDLINGTWEPSARPVVEDDKATIRFSPGSKNTIRVSRRGLWISLFVVGLYFGSSPNIGFKWTPFYSWLWHITPKTYPEPHRFAQTIGAVLIVFSINHSPDIQKLFTNPFSQYLGKISFAFYVVHGPVLHCLGYSIMPHIWNLTGKETNFQYCLGFLIGWLICLPVAIWLGDVFWRAVDIPSVKFARSLEDRLISKGPASGRPSLATHAE